MKERRIAEVKSIGYSCTNGVTISLVGYPSLMFIKPEEVHHGGKNCELRDIVVGGKIEFDAEIHSAARELHNVIIISDGIREVDADGNLIKW